MSFMGDEEEVEEDDSQDNKGKGSHKDRFVVSFMVAITSASTV
jgi:hypothetical protein